jgi:hypothetical protein
MQKTSLFSVAQALLLTALGISAPAMADHAKITDGTLYIRKEITGASGIVNLIDSNTAQLVGVSSFDKTKLPAGQQMVLERIRLAYATAASDNTDGVVKQSYSNKYSKVPSVLSSAHLIVTQSGKRIVEIPVQLLLTNDSEEQVLGDDAYFLQALRLLQPQVDLEIQLKFPEGLGMEAGKKHFLEINFIGPRSV